MLASQGDHHRAVEFLLQNRAGIDHRNDEGFTALIIASRQGHHRVVRALLQNGATVSCATNTGFTALMFSARHGHFVIAAMLVRAGAELEARSEYSHTALHMAAYYGHISMVKLLVGAAVNLDTYLPTGEGPLYSAAFHGHVDIVRLLLSLGVNPARAVDHYPGDKRVPLGLADQPEHRETARELLQLGIEACGGAPLRTAAFVLSAFRQHFDVMAMLRDAGATDTEGEALFTAAYSRHEEVVKFLLTAGVGYP